MKIETVIEEIFGSLFVDSWIFLVTFNNITYEVIMEYIKNQNENEKDEDFTVS